MTRDEVLILIFGMIFGALVLTLLMRRSSARASASLTENIETWEVVRDESGRIKEIIVHRKQEGR